MAPGIRSLVGVGAIAVLAVAGLGATASPAGAAPPPKVRFATFNASLNRAAAGQLVGDLSAPLNPPSADTALQARRQQAANVAEIIQRTRPDVLLVNEFDFVEGGVAADLFQQNYLGVSQTGAQPITYPYRYVAPSNTGIQSGFNLDNDAVTANDPDDAFGFGFFPGQFGLAVFSKYPIDVASVRTFQLFLWKDMPGNLIPPGFFDADELAVLRLSSKSHWDLPIQIGIEDRPLPRQPSDAAGVRRARRPQRPPQLRRDPVLGRLRPPAEGLATSTTTPAPSGGLAKGARFVIAGDQNSDPFDGDSIPGSAQLLLDSPKVNATCVPESLGGPEAAAIQGQANLTHRGDPRFDTADFADSAPGNLRVDYVLPSKRGLTPLASAVFWPTTTDPLYRLTGTFNPNTFGGNPSSDHRLVWLDVRVR